MVQYAKIGLICHKQPRNLFTKLLSGLKMKYFAKRTKIPKIGNIIGVLVGAMALVVMQGCSPAGNIEQTTPQKFDYAAKAADWPKCDSPRPAKGTEIPAIGKKMKTAGEIPFFVKVPANYDPTVAHPLLVLYAPGGQSAAQTDRYYKISAEATGRGFIVAVARDRRPAIETLEDFGSIPDQLASEFCINKQRVYATGHSNGGLVSNAVAFLPKLHNKFTAIAPSAGGIRKQDIEKYKCPNPMSVMVLHNTGDSLFPIPAHGRGVAEYWAKCNGCDPTSVPTKIKGCVAYPACKSDVTTLYCEGPGGHSRWPDKNKEILDFFSN